MHPEQKSFYERVGGRAALEKVHKLFYTRAFSHPWLGQYFYAHVQEVLELQQTQFMSYLMGGPNEFAGFPPKKAHAHMNIPEELFLIRQRLLSEAIQEAGLSDELREEWLALDARMKFAIVKKDVSECSSQETGKAIVDFPNPARRQAKN